MWQGIRNKRLWEEIKDWRCFVSRPSYDRESTTVRWINSVVSANPCALHRTIYCDDCFSILNPPRENIMYHILVKSKNLERSALVYSHDFHPLAVILAVTPSGRRASVSCIFTPHLVE